MLALDTHILVRLVTNDDPVAAQCTQLALNAELAIDNKCMVGHIVLCELVWVLQRLYAYSVQQCQRTIRSLITFEGLRFKASPVVLAAYMAWEKHGGDWADHLLGAQMQSLGCGAVLTPDKATSRASTYRKL